MIPKIIHYCWFGGNPLPNEYKKYVESWIRFCPNYEIKRWDETNFDVNICPYVKKAYQNKKWAFVSDFARFYILEKYGGIYLDTDVEIIKPLDDIVNKGPFAGIEMFGTSVKIATGLILAAEKHMFVLNEIMAYYYHSDFEYKSKIGEQITVVDIVTNIFKKHGFQNYNISQNICGFRIYPSDYFCPMNCVTRQLIVTEHTYTIHHYSGSWQHSSEKIKRKIKKIIGPNVTRLIIKTKSLTKNNRGKGELN